MSAVSWRKVALPFLLVSLIWGSTWLVIATQISSVPPQWSVVWRFFVAAIGMVALALLRGESLKLAKPVLGLAAMLGVAQFAMNFNFVYRAEGFITSGLVAVIFALLILPNALFSQWFLGQRSGRGFWLGTAIAATGVALLIAHELRIAPMGTRQVLIGTGLTLAAVLCASASNVVQGAKRLAGIPTVPLLAWAMGFGVLFDAIWALATAGPPVLDTSPGYLAGVVYLGLIGSVLTFPLYFNLIRDIGAGRAAYSSVVIPVIAMALSTIFEGYRWTLLAAAGGVLVLAGMVVAMSSRNPSTKEG